MTKQSRTHLESTRSEAFRSTVRAWLTHAGELLVMLRHHAAAGARDFEFFTSAETLLARLDALPSRTSVIVFRERQLPLRGRADEALRAQALATLRDGDEWLWVELEPTVAGPMRWYGHNDGTSHAELTQALEECEGALVALGAYPPWLEDSDVVLAAVVPSAEDSVQPGIY